MNNKYVIIFSSIIGYVLTILCRFNFIKPVKHNNSNRKIRKKVIVSLTSYGRRVNKVLPYTIISLLRQTYKPDELILWLDNENWNTDNIPVELRRLERFGLKICFCEDLKSYKKLIPSLTRFPESLIITADDDVYYRSDTVERLVHEYELNPNRIYCHTAHGMIIDSQRGLLKYNEWKMNVENACGQLVFPVGEGCILYDSKLLYKDITKVELFQKLSPLADDVWFFFMGKLQNTESYVLPYVKIPFFPLDFFYQHFHQKASLAKANVSLNMNDQQIKNVMNYYNIKVDREQQKLII